MNRHGMLSIRRKILYAVATTSAFFALVECGLRMFGFERDTSIASMRFTFPLDDYNGDAGVAFLDRDPVLFWKPKAHVLGHNSRGIFGPEFTNPKSPELFRIVCLGDSCTHFGPDPYPQRLHAILAARAPKRFEVINAGVIGWSSHQGLTRLRTQVSQWAPDLVTVYFGWNDHWLALGYRDGQHARLSWFRAIHNGLDHLRLYQLLMLARPNGQHRVELTEYRQNLRRMKQICDRLGARIWFLTAPHALDLGLPGFLLTSGEVADPEGLVELHRQYNDQVRRVAKELGVTLIDLERKFDTLQKQSLFVEDHIHLSDAGLTLVAQILLQTMVEQDDLPAP